ncbi:MAG: ATP-binding protein [Acidaminobacteraceae bacterium]
MNKKYISLRFAVVTPLFLIMIGVLATFVILNRADYNWMAKEQGTKILESLYTNIENELNSLLAEPEIANKYYEDVVARMGDHSNSELSSVQELSLGVLDLIIEDLPQVSAIGFGNENGDYVGFRVNGDGSKNLMLNDSRTAGLLNIYSGEQIDSEVIESYEGYDVRVRPWYKPVKENKSRQWSEIYVNNDEKMEMTITTLTPILDKIGEFKGVVALDVKLSMIKEFLKNNKLKQNGVIYIIDNSWNIISTSTDEEYTKIIESNPPVAKMIEAYESENPIIRKSSREILKEEIELGQFFQIEIDSQRYFSLYFPLRQAKELEWKIVVVIPEKDIMGAVKENQDATLSLVIIVLLIATGIGILLLTLIISPIRSSSNAVTKISEGDWNFELIDRKIKTFEVEELIAAFETMRCKMKESFTKLEISESKYRVLIENTDDMIYSITPKGYIISMNKSFEKEAGAPHNTYIGVNFAKIFKLKDNVVLWEKNLKEVVESKVTKSLNFEYINKSNIRTILNVKLSPQLNDKGEVEFILGTNTKITELIEAQEKIEELLKLEKKELEKLVEKRTKELEDTMAELIDREKLASLGSLVSGIAHEVNTPLGVAVTAGSYLDMINRKMSIEMKSGKISKRSFNEYIDNINESSSIININIARASELIRSFKEISVNQRVEDVALFNLYEYIQSILIALKHEYKNTSHTFEVICPIDLKLNSYQGVFSQIITNLIMNSLLHGFEGVSNGLITIKASKSKDIFELVFKDNGNGISDENLAYIFDPFFTTNRKQGGSGLGLNIIYNLVTGKLGGKISCESVVGEGTTFIIVIPI